MPPNLAAQSKPYSALSRMCVGPSGLSNQRQHPTGKGYAGPSVLMSLRLGLRPPAYPQGAMRNRNADCKSSIYEAESRRTGCDWRGWSLN